MHMNILQLNYDIYHFALFYVICQIQNMQIIIIEVINDILLYTIIRYV